MPYVKKSDLEDLEGILKRLVESGKMEHTDFNDILKIQTPGRTLTIKEKDVTKFIKERTSGFRSAWIVHIAENGLEVIKKYKEDRTA